MKRNELCTVITTAMGTAALLITAFWPDSLDAGGEPAELSPKISKPKLVAGGVEFSLAPAERRDLSAGDEPVFELTALNTNSEKAQANVRIAMTATSPADALSRVVRTPSMLWQTEQSVALAPRESKTLTLNTRTKLPPNNLISVLLQDNAAGPSTPLTVGPQPAIKPEATPAPASSMITALTFLTITPNREQTVFTAAPSAPKEIVH